MHRSAREEAKNKFGWHAGRHAGRRRHEVNEVSRIYVYRVAYDKLIVLGPGRLGNNVIFQACCGNKDGKKYTNNESGWEMKIKQVRKIKS